MRNLLLELRFNGTHYHGYQVQANNLTIAEVVQDAIQEVIHVREPIVGCSRTDAGVHANSYFLHMKTECRIPPDNLLRGLNTVLPDDICVLSCREVPLSFHARYLCCEKEYLYKIWNLPIKNPFLNQLALHYKKPINVELLNHAAKAFLGTHDFSAFCAAKADAEGSVRTITCAEVYRDGDMVFLRFRGDGFLYNMVRIMVGTLLAVQEGRFTAADIPAILESRDRVRAGRTAKACGLYLNQVIYQSDNEENHG